MNEIPLNSWQLLQLGTLIYVHRLLGVSLQTRDVPVLQTTTTRGRVAVAVGHDTLTPAGCHQNEPSFFSMKKRDTK